MDFLDRLKKVMVEESESRRFSACRYFETILQHKDELKPLLQDAENFSDVDIYYDEYDYEGYTNGNFKIRFNNGFQFYAPHEYKLELLRDDRHWGYCECKPSFEGYDPIHKCCGNGCDWTAPRVSIDRIECIADFSFDGYERDMWELEKKWNGKQDLENERLTNQINYIDEEIQRLMEEKELINKKLNSST